MRTPTTRHFKLVAWLVWCFWCGLPGFADGESSWLGPSALVWNPANRWIYVAGERGRQVLAISAEDGRTVWRVSLAGSVTGLTLSLDRARLAALTTEPDRVSILDSTSGRLDASWPVGAGASAPVWAGKDRVLYVCERFANKVSLYESTTGVRLAEIPVLREPLAAALSPDESRLLVPNHLPEGRADTNNAASAVTLIDTRARAIRQHIRLPAGATALRGVAVDPTGTWGAVTHGLARYQAPATQVEQGWMNLAALSLIDLKTEMLRATILLDEPQRGAANPWALAWSSDAKWLCVTHAGTHELSVIDFPGLTRRLDEHPAGGVVGDLALLNGIRRRMPLSEQGPRCLLVQYPRAYTGNFFADTLAVVNLFGGAVERSLPLSQRSEVAPERWGEQIFNDATRCHQHWQSCASCHPDGRADGLNWDLLNDGIGNPKNTKSLLFAPQTPPAMSLGVRGTAATAVRSGFRHILFTVPNEKECEAVSAYLRAMRPAINPHLVGSKLTPVAERGRTLFESKEVGCAACHPAPLFTDMKSHDVGTLSKRQSREKQFDTPALVECWRTTPYLHDGSAVTLRDVLTSRNPQDQHGHVSHLTPGQLDDLLAYVQSL